MVVGAFDLVRAHRNQELLCAQKKKKKKTKKDGEEKISSKRGENKVAYLELGRGVLLEGELGVVALPIEPEAGLYAGRAAARASISSASMRRTALTKNGERRKSESER
jgi:hypothetical protein